jgi:antitoxin component of MazEF toxin-antitoxin module
MRLVVKKWGNGLAVRLPRESAELGRLQEGDALEVSASRIGVSRSWKPATWRGGPKDLSVNHDHVIEEILEEKVKRWRSPTQVS